MIGQELRDFVDDALDAGRMSEPDVLRLASTILTNGVMRRAEVDALAALDRLVADRPAAWDATYVDLVSAYVTAEAETAGEVSRDMVNWLVTTLDAGGAMTDNGLRIAIEITRAANHVDQTLMTFVLQNIQARRLSPEPAGAVAPMSGTQVGITETAGAVAAAA